jgi:hypothetical protein
MCKCIVERRSCLQAKPHVTTCSWSERRKKNSQKVSTVYRLCLSHENSLSRKIYGARPSLIPECVDALLLDLWSRHVKSKVLLVGLQILSSFTDFLCPGQAPKRVWWASVPSAATGSILEVFYDDGAVDGRGVVVGCLPWSVGGGFGDHRQVGAGLVRTRAWASVVA